MAKKELEFEFGLPVFTKEKRPVKFNHNKILVSDIWAFWNYIIKEYSSTDTKKNILLSLLEQSKTFFNVAEQAEMRSKPLLYYYSFLNFAKIAIELHSSFDIHQRFDHGINPLIMNNRYNFNTDKVEILKLNSGNINPSKRSVCYEFMEIVESSINHSFPPTLQIGIKELLQQCIGVHRTYTNIYNEQEIFSRIDNLKLYKDGKFLIFNAELVDGIKNVNYNNLKTFYNFIEKDSKAILEIKYQMPNYTITDKARFLLSKEIRDKGIWYFITKDEYKYYISHTNKPRYSPSFTIYLTMFYLGSITRYHPYLFDEIFSQSEQWLISEFLKNQPTQFLYLTTSKILGAELRVSYSKL